MNAPAGWVVDASVGAKLFVAEPLSDQAHALFSGLAADPPADLYVPDLFNIECANLLWKYVCRGRCSGETALANLSDLGVLRLHSTATYDLMEEALALAIERNLNIPQDWHAIRLPIFPYSPCPAR